MNRVFYPRPIWEFGEERDGRLESGPQDTLFRRARAFFGRTNALKSADRTDVVVGFLTDEGLDALFASGLQESRVRRFVIGRGTRNAWAAVRDLRDLRRREAIRVHLGYALRPGTSPIVRGHRPMMHSKIYYFEGADGVTTAFIGSHNATGFALRGKNAEAGFLVSGSAFDQPFKQIRHHIETVWSEAVIFDESLIEAYVRINKAAADSEADTTDADLVLEQTGLVLNDCILPGSASPKTDDIIYFAIPNAEQSEQKYFSALGRRIDLYLYPVETFSNRPSATPAQIVAVEATTRSTQQPEGTTSTVYNVQWMIRDFYDPKLERAPASITGDSSAMNVELQVRQVLGDADHFEYYHSAKSRMRFLLKAAGESLAPSGREGTDVPDRAEDLCVVREIVRIPTEFLRPRSPESVFNWIAKKERRSGFHFIKTKGRRRVNEP